MTRAKAKGKRRVIKIATIVLSLLVVLHCAATVAIYEIVFSGRFTTPEWMPCLEDYDGLLCERSDFLAEGDVRLAGYKYSREGVSVRGVAVISHGFGNGHRPYLPMIDLFASAGYLVFAYDGTGTDQSEGSGTKGLVRAVSDLEHAILHAKEQEDYRGLPIVLFGHSMGAYAAGAVLSLVDDIAAAVLVAPFNESENMLKHNSSRYIGALAGALLPSVAYYEWLKFGAKYADASVVDSVKGASAEVLIVAANDDATVPTDCGIDIMERALAGTDGVTIIRMQSGGHTDLMYSASARRYREELLASFGGDAEGARYDEYMQKSIDKEIYFELNGELFDEILTLFENACRVGGSD